ncbi:MAG: DUF374 domain-containing protein [Myxococcota bacterium]
MTKLLRYFVGTMAALWVHCLRLTCRFHIVDDPRLALRRQGLPYVVGMLHAHQIACLMALKEKRGGYGLVSRSADGDYTVPLILSRGVKPIRGSTSKNGRSKGGAEALVALREGLAQGIPCYISVDGPRGPRGHVHRGIAQLAIDSGAPIILGVFIPARRWVLRSTWDRFQIAKPFTRISVHFVTLRVRSGESLELLRQRIADSLRDLEHRFDSASEGFDEKGGIKHVESPEKTISGNR